MNWPELIDFLFIGGFLMACVFFIFQKIKKIFAAKKNNQTECVGCSDSSCNKSAKGDCQPVEIKFHR